MKKIVFPVTNGSVTTPKGFKASGIYAGIKQKGKDIACIVSDAPAFVAGMFTTNKMPAHCVVFNKLQVRDGCAQALIVNAGNANCCTGEQGWQDTVEMARLTALLLSLDKNQVLVLSTGIIGEPMPMDKIRNGIDRAVTALSGDGGLDAAQAIMTTDTVPKNYSVEFELDDKLCSIGVIAKGSGMINPNLATMFCIFTTDVYITSHLLQQAFKDTVKSSLNMLTVDGEMSTNDTALLFANGAARNNKIEAKTKNYYIFCAALKALSVKVTKAIAEDGEGATKLVTVTVSGAHSKKQAVLAAKSIANSMLVKTAIFGKDPNWGRIVQSAGASGALINIDKFSVEFAGIKVAENGGNTSFDKTLMSQALEEKNINVAIDLAVGKATATVFTCDLTHDYVTINADYHT